MFFKKKEQIKQTEETDLIVPDELPKKE